MQLRYAIMVLIMTLIASGTRAEVITEHVSYRHDDVSLEGFLAYDNAIEDKRPGVLVVHEWWGLNEYARGRAIRLAGMGYVAFALDMYGKGKVTENFKQARVWYKKLRVDVDLWRKRALAGLEVLKRHPKTDPSRVAAIGYSFGGTTVQHLAYTGADIHGVVSFHGSLVMPKKKDTNERVKAKILICHGGADPLVKAKEIQKYVAAMEASGLNWQMIIYGGAKHSFTNPTAYKAGSRALAYSKTADHRSWAHMKQFFGEIF